ncbi:hypothetical protein GCM10007916_10770 [Psychromonas marina]|uniref:DUF3466 family protein n=1 Tax=Psychromonas marina TaxID=88364 RepID=A0ABQ6DY55_9GAMM|nr:DUF3466 family protein [Psychromonas marina]GLS90010.1 hypothetical protein GCM10007916_10770 [Psychromonas marina]
MKFKLTLVSASLALLLANSSWAEGLPYYNIVPIDVDNGLDESVGAYPVAMSDDGNFIATASIRAAISRNIDIGLPFTFNRDCQYDDDICELEFEGSESAADFSYYNAYKAWRNAQADASSGYERYMFANTLLDLSDDARDTVFGSDASSDVKITDVSDEIDTMGNQRYLVGYTSAPYIGGEREFVRRAYIEDYDGNAIELVPEFTSNGGFSSAYKLQQVTYTDGTEKTLVIGASSRSYPDDDDDRFNDCYNSDEDDYRYNYNDLVYCPGFDTQAWAWDVSDLASEPTNFALATTWLENNETNRNSLTFSANAFDMNKSGIAVGASTFEYGRGTEGARQRAIIMTPDEAGNYTKPTELTAAVSGIDDQEDSIYNTWALTISEAGIVTGNREYDTVKGRNQPIEFFVYNNETNTVKFPLLDKKVATTKQYLDNGSHYITKSGANSRIYDANEDGLMVGEVDGYDQNDPVYQGNARSQSAFLYNNESNEAWLLNDLICSMEADDEVTSPFIRIRSATVISDSDENGDHVILAEGFEYANAEAYNNKIGAVPMAFKLTRNLDVATPGDSPNCWESDLLQSSDEDYERQGAASFWLWLFALPMLFIRRFKK